MEYYKANFSKLISNLVLSFIFFFTLSLISKVDYKILFFIMLIFFVGWLIPYYKRNKIFSIRFDDQNQKIIVKKNAFTKINKEYSYKNLSYLIKNYSVGRHVIKDVLFVYNGNENIFIIGESLVSGWKTSDIIKIKEKIATISRKKTFS